jgi:hypothetical protein
VSPSRLERLPFPLMCRRESDPRVSQRLRSRPAEQPSNCIATPSWCISGASKTRRSLLLAVSSSTINKLGEYMILISWQRRLIRISVFDSMKSFCYHSFDLRQLVSLAEIASNRQLEFLHIPRKGSIHYHAAKAVTVPIRILAHSRTISSTVRGREPARVERADRPWQCLQDHLRKARPLDVAAVAQWGLGHKNHAKTESTSPLRARKPAPAGRLPAAYFFPVSLIARCVS